MRKIEEIDKNFAAKSADENGFVWYDCTEAPFQVYGLMHTGDCFVRMPQEVANNVSDGVASLNTSTAGGRVRFATDSWAIMIRATMHNLIKIPLFALTGSAGFDLYADNTHAGTFAPPMDIEDCYTATVYTDGRMHDMVIHFPLYSGVKQLEIGIREGASLMPGAKYKTDLPVVYYGSSITQGGCASRPGNSYPAVVSRMLDCDFVNLGFSGNARGEATMAQYIAHLPMSAFVFDYDHNAPGPEHLQNTHAKMFGIIREKNPALPVIMMTRPDSFLNSTGEQNRKIIMKTYTDAVEAGDRNVFFIDGRGFVRDGDGTVDNCHPNDLGFRYMAETVGELLKKIL